MASKFYIENENSQRWGLNALTEGVFVEPKGFGIKYNNKYSKVGDRWVATDEELSQPQPEGKIVFGHNPYVIFNEFVNFLNSAKELKLVFVPSGLKDEYYADVDLIQLDKGGYSTRTDFVVPIKFVCKSLFYKKQDFVYKLERGEKDIRWDFRWDVKFNDLNNIYFTLENDSHAETPFLLNFKGQCLNPKIMVVQNGKVVKETKFTVELGANDTLKLSTHDTDLFVTINDTPRFDILDFTKDNFFKLPTGKSEIFFQCESGKMQNIVLSLEKYYKGV